MLPARPKSTVSARPRNVREWSYSTLATSRPKAESTPGASGTMIVEIPSARARAPAWTGPAPPNATKLNCRGSSPRWTETSRIASAIRALMIRKMPSAVSRTLFPMAVATRCIAASARSTRSRTSPPAKKLGFR